ncbi:hypothetical protein C1707_23905 [Caulobacter flavus]|uniref:DUF6966 domain-containing protein n=1 Tax=Caulobacter flavus TaxID=1679497 RepID=A0ABN5QQ09_9CAUL|nr:hypothetical protein [Caulobacter flavus]AYV49053.1 hypothetical protein C1707_23905 [Caulobacter flavus]
MLWFLDRWKSLTSRVDEIARLLRTHGEPEWAGDLQDMARRVRRRDDYGLEAFLRCFGGAGTLNHIVLIGNGRASPQANARLRRLLSKTSTQASRLSRDVDKAR